MMGLTHRQAECLEFIRATIRERGIVPAYDEIAAALGFKSKTSVLKLIIALENLGYIRRIPKCARAIEVLKQPASQLDIYERGLQLIRAMTVPAPARIARAKLTTIRLPAFSDRAGQSPGGGKGVVTLSASGGTHSGRRA